MLRKFLDNVEKKILSNDKLKRFYPLHDALDTFLYSTNKQTSNAPYVRDSIDLKRTMIIVVLALLPSFFFGVYNIGLQSPEISNSSFVEYFIYGLYRVLPMYLVVFGVGGLCEAIFAVVRKHEINEGFLVTGFLIPLTMPPTIPLWMLAIATIFGVVIGKEVFGGTGMNILNPALTARAFAFFAYPTYMSGNTVWVSEAGVIDGVSGETILGKLAAGTDVPYTSMDMFSGLIPGSISETSTICILAGALLLILTKVGSWRIIFSGFIGAACMALIFNWLGGAYFPDNDLMNFPWYNHLIVDGLAFGVVFMATDPVSAAQTFKGKWIYGFLIGLFAVMIRVFNPAYPEGIMLAILLMNVFAPTIDHFVIESNVKKRKKRVKAQVKTA